LPRRIFNRNPTVRSFFLRASGTRSTRAPIVSGIGARAPPTHYQQHLTLVIPVSSVSPPGPLSELIRTPMVGPSGTHTHHPWSTRRRQDSLGRQGSPDLPFASKVQPPRVAPVASRPWLSSLCSQAEQQIAISPAWPPYGGRLLWACLGWIGSRNHSGPPTHRRDLVFLRSGGLWWTSLFTQHRPRPGTAQPPTHTL